MSKTVFSGKFDINDEKKLRTKLESDGFLLTSVDHAFWQAQRERVFITFYRSGKVVIRGRNVDYYVEEYLTELKTNQEVHGLEAIKNLSEWIGSDESGKGDFFGPLVVAAVYVDKKVEHKLWLLGVQDSKKMTDQKIVEMAKSIKQICTHSVVSLMPKKYNMLYGEVKNLNKLLASVHAQVIQNVIDKTDCNVIIADKFADERLIRDEIENVEELTLIQRNRAEANLAVAAASILAREKFISGLDKMGEKYLMEFPPGASAKVVHAGKLFVKKHGKGLLKNVAKTHFKTVNQLNE